MVTPVLVSNPKPPLSEAADKSYVNTSPLLGFVIVTVSPELYPEPGLTIVKAVIVSLSSTVVLSVKPEPLPLSTVV